MAGPGPELNPAAGQLRGPQCGAGVKLGWRDRGCGWHKIIVRVVFSLSFSEYEKSWACLFSHFKKCV